MFASNFNSSTGNNSIKHSFRDQEEFTAETQSYTEFKVFKSVKCSEVCYFIEDKAHVH